ncbi:hypothetical protein Tco_0164791 [Tanacetum coccineum]
MQSNPPAIAVQVTTTITSVQVNPIGRGAEALSDQEEKLGKHWFMKNKGGIVKLCFRSHKVLYEEMRKASWEIVERAIRSATWEEKNGKRVGQLLCTCDRIQEVAHILRLTIFPQCEVMRFLALGWHLEEIHVTWAHLEKKWTRPRTYTKSLEELCSQSVETASQA